MADGVGQKSSPKHLNAQILNFQNLDAKAQAEIKGFVALGSKLWGFEGCAPGRDEGFC